MHEGLVGKEASNKGNERLLTTVDKREQERQDATAVDTDRRSAAIGLRGNRSTERSTGNL